jgi:hypothetical protein
MLCRSDDRSHYMQLRLNNQGIKRSRMRFRFMQLFRCYMCTCRRARLRSAGGEEQPAAAAAADMKLCRTRASQVRAGVRLYRRRQCSSSNPLTSYITLHQCIRANLDPPLATHIVASASLQPDDVLLIRQCPRVWLCQRPLQKRHYVGTLGTGRRSKRRHTSARLRTSIAAHTTSIAKHSLQAVGTGQHTCRSDTAHAP